MKFLFYNSEREFHRVKQTPKAALTLFGRTRDNAHDLVDLVERRRAGEKWGSEEHFGQNAPEAPHVDSHSISNHMINQYVFEISVALYYRTCGKFHFLCIFYLRFDVLHVMI